MGFKKTSEGRVFFKSANNDDLPTTTLPPPSDDSLPKDSGQGKILPLLKTLNETLQESREDNAEMKKALDIYKAKIKLLEERTLKQQSHYSSLEKKISDKHNNIDKKAMLAETEVKATLKQLDEARDLVKKLEEKSGHQDSTLKNLKESQQKQSEEMVSNVAAYTALTKRVVNTEELQNNLNGKVEETTSAYLKLDRKIDKVVEDRNRLLRKIERIEGAVLETRDALTAKAMVLLTDQGTVTGTNATSPLKISHDTLTNDPMVIKRRLEEEALMPWWRRPVRLQAASLIMILCVVLLLGWILSAAHTPISKEILLNHNRALPPKITLGTSENMPHQNGLQRPPSQDALLNMTGNSPYSAESYETETPNDPVLDFASKYATKKIQNEEAIKPAPLPPLNEEEEPLDIHNDTQMLAAMDSDPARVAKRLNEIEPGRLSEDDTKAVLEKPSASPNRTPKTNSAPLPPLASLAPPPDREQKVVPRRVVSSAYKTSLRRRISSDRSLDGVAKKIESRAFEGVPEAQHDMGAIYVAGRGNVRRNLKRAVFWFTEAANNGVANAKYNLGVLYHQGLGVSADMDKAMQLYKQASEMDHPEAQYNLGIANIEGIGMPYNPGNAARYFESAAQQGVVEAAYNLGLIYENGLLGETQPDIALTWYKYAADSGSPEAKSAMRQLASSLGVSIEDISRIIENVKRSHTSFSNAHDTRSLIASTQSELMTRGLYPGPVDGMLGPMTRKAIENFQRSANLRDDGEPSIELLQYLKASTNYSQYQ